MNRTLKLRLIMAVSVVLVFIAVLLYIIFSVMRKHSTCMAQSDAIIYMHHGKPVLATVVKEFKAHTVSKHGGLTHVSGATACYARTIDLESGQERWNVRLKAKNNHGKDWGDAVLLGQSDKYLFFIRNDIYVISKEDGTVVARNKDLPTLKDKLLTESTIYPSLTTNYIWEDSLHGVVIKGADGLAYLLDGNTLQSRVLPEIKINDYFFRKQVLKEKEASKNYNDHLITFMRRNGLQMAFMDENDSSELQEGHIPDYGPQQSPRRSLYTSQCNLPLRNLAKLNDKVFIYGGFLKAPLPDSQDLFKQDPEFHKGIYQLLSRGNSQGHTPVELPDGGYVILHKASVASNAPILLTALTPDGHKRWHLPTTMQQISRVWQMNDRLLVLSADANGNGGTANELLDVDLKNGKARTYSFKEGKYKG